MIGVNVIASVVAMRGQVLKHVRMVTNGMRDRRDQPTYNSPYATVSFCVQHWLSRRIDFHGNLRRRIADQCKEELK